MFQNYLNWRESEKVDDISVFIKSSVILYSKKSIKLENFNLMDILEWIKKDTQFTLIKQGDYNTKN